MCQKTENICPALNLFQAEVLPFVAAVNYTSQLLQSMHVVEYDPIKSTKYFSCHSTIQLFLLSLFPNCRTSEEFIFLNCSTFSVLLSFPMHTCELCLSQSHHSSDVAPDVLQWNSAIFSVDSSDTSFLPFTQREVQNICLGPFSVHGNQKQTLLD